MWLPHSPFVYLWYRNKEKNNKGYDLQRIKSSIRKFR